MKIAIIVGTRPEIIKMASVIDEIKRRGIDFVVLHSGQHYDGELSDVFFEDLELPAPDYNINVGSASHGIQTGMMLSGFEEVLVDENPDIVLVQGDTNAVLAGSIVSSKLHLAVGHVEAGLRSFDLTMPEEINRMVSDVCSTMYFAPTEDGAINLIAEDIPREEIFITGNTVVDACYRNLKIAQRKGIESDYLKAIDIDNLDNLLTLTMHRAETVDNKERLTNVINAFKELKEVNIIFPIHPRTKKNLEIFGLFKDLDELDNVHILKPIGYLDFLNLISKSDLVLTDSGGIQEEAITLDVPALTLRYNTERPETVKCGGNILVGTDTNLIVDNVRKIIEDEEFANKMRNAKNPYGDGNTSVLIVDAIEEYYKKGLLNISAPDMIDESFKRKMAVITEDITVDEFEKKYNTAVHLVYDNNKMVFPYDDLNLKDLMITYDEYN